MNMKRMRGRNHRPNGGGGGGSGGFRNQQNGIPLNRNHVFDSSGPEMRVRGTAQQLFDKYQQMARDASSNGDRVLGEAYYQHAEHYFRIISAINQAQGQPNPAQAGQPQHQHQERAHYQPQPQNGQNEYQRREYGNAEQGEQPMEAREQRPQENRQQHEPRRFEQRPRQEYQRNDRQERNDRPERNNEQRYRPEPVADPRIDISSALEAELAAATAGLPGFGEQPEIAAAPPPAEPRAIPIIPDAPPVAEAAEVPAPRVPRPRGRPRRVPTEKVD